MFKHFAVIFIIIFITAQPVFDIILKNEAQNYELYDDLEDSEKQKKKKLKDKKEKKSGGSDVSESLTYQYNLFSKTNYIQEINSPFKEFSCKRIWLEIILPPPDVCYNLNS